MNAPVEDTRVLIVGSPGAGKSTLARQLGTVTGLPVRHLDDEYWGLDWTRLDAADWERHQSVMTIGSAWILDGNYLSTMRLRAGRATLVVLVDAMTAVCVLRVLSRALEVRRGSYDSLPRSVRGQAIDGVRVPATKDFIPLLKQILRFRRNEWWQVVELAPAQQTELVVAVSDRRWGHATRVRRRLARKGVHIPVVDVVDLPGLIR